MYTRVGVPCVTSQYLKINTCMLIFLIPTHRIICTPDGFKQLNVYGLLVCSIVDNLHEFLNKGSKTEMSKLSTIELTTNDSIKKKKLNRSYCCRELKALAMI